MVSTRFHHVSIATLSAMAALLIAASWWYLQQASCAGDLKSDTGNIAEALSLENKAFYVHLAGIIGVTAAVLMNSFGRVKWFWLRAAALLTVSPAIAYVTFLALGLFGGHGAWVCANALSR